MEFRLRQKVAFTLVELLVTLAVIGVLAAVTLPVTKVAIERSRLLKCSSNLHHIHIALGAYLIDHEQRMPVVHNQNLEPFLSSYLGNENKVFHCPSDFTKKGGSYHWNAVLNGQIATNLGFTMDVPLIGKIEVRNLRDISVLGDNQYRHRNSLSGDHRSNVLYADGSVSLFEPKLMTEQGAAANP